jgi:hypothetical protein
MQLLSQYMDDGANCQAQATLAFLRDFNIEQSWNSKWGRYEAEVVVARWDNGREHGYVLCLFDTRQLKQLNIAFFEHRVCDSLSAWKWESGCTINPPTWEDAPDNIHRNPAFEVEYGEVVKMAEWIEDQFINFWLAGSAKTEKAEVAK